MNEVVFVEQRPMEGREVSPSPDAVIGREGTDIVLADPEVSRRHAAIREHNGGVAIEDLGSTNGTYVNDERVSGLRPLNDGDTVRLGNTVWRVKASVSDATAVGHAQVAPPQVTAARAVPSDLRAPATAPQPTTAGTPAQAAPAAPAPAAAAAVAAPSPQSIGPRGDVAPPPDVAPSAIRRVLPPPTAPPAFTTASSRRVTSRRGSAAKQVEWTIVCLAIVIAVAVVLAIYFASYK